MSLLTKFEVKPISGLSEYARTLLNKWEAMKQWGFDQKLIRPGEIHNDCNEYARYLWA